MEQHPIRNGLSKLTPVATLAFAFIVQVVAVAVFIARVDSRVAVHEEILAQVRVQLAALSTELRGLEERIDRQDTPLAHRVDGIDKNLTSINDRTVQNSHHLDEISRDVTRMNERIDKIVQALDSFYSQFVDYVQQQNKR